MTPEKQFLLDLAEQAEKASIEALRLSQAENVKAKSLRLVAAMMPDDHH